MKRDGFNVSLWQSALPSYISKTSLLPDDVQDVVIIGGGITGVTSALMLQKAGKSCTLLEAQELGFGTTGGTTAHLNTMMDTTYPEIESKFNAEAAEMIADMSTATIRLIKRNVDEYHIDCGFEYKSAYLFAKDEQQEKDLKDIHDGAKKVHLPITYSKDVPTPIPYKRAIEAKQQAQFHPLKYIVALAQEFEKLGGKIIQQCRVTDVTKEGDILSITSFKGKMKARTVIYATHIPPGVNMLHFECAPYRTYAMAIRLKDDNYPDALIYDLDDPYHYYRTQEVDGQKYLIAGGEDHKTGHEKNTDNCFTKLEAYVRHYYNIDHIAYRWSSQYFEPADGLPYIGHLPGNPEEVYVATGFGGNGMIYGTAAAAILTDMICNGKNQYTDLFKPSRVKPIAEFQNLAKEGADVTASMMAGWVSIPKLEELAGLAKGEAKVVKYEGNPVALYKDDKGTLHAVNPACPHIKCSVGWNNTEKSWDCPCHGSRYSYTGELLCAPSRDDLHIIDLRKDE
jgi:glycine/D-amino acid oxidase-like deaminating enzyme/nitrite reductase/ring-hydroxylating ferredoxin subunit